MNNPVVIVVLVLAFVALSSLLYITFKSKNVSEENHTATTSTPETYLEPLRKALALEQAMKEFFDVYRKATNADRESSREGSNALFNEWELFSLGEVLNAKTLEQLVWANKLALEDSLAAKFVPIQKERISALEVEIAGSNVEKLITAARMAPKGGQAEMLAFSKLQRLLLNKQ